MTRAKQSKNKVPNGADRHTDRVHGGRTYAPCVWLTRTHNSYEAIIRNGNLNAKSKAKAEFIFHGAQNAVIFLLKWKIVAFVSFEFLSNCLMAFSLGLSAAQWFRKVKKWAVSTGPLAHPFACTAHYAVRIA